MSEGREAILGPAEAYVAQCIQKWSGKGVNSEPFGVPKSFGL